MVRAHMVNTLRRYCARAQVFGAIALAALLSACATPAALPGTAPAPSARATAAVAPSLVPTRAATPTAAPAAESPALPCITSPGVATPDRFNPPMNPLPSVAAGNIAGSIDVAGQKRTYLVHVPAAINCGIESVPLLIVFHADEGNAQQMMDLSRFNAIADSQVFVVAYPNGSNGSAAWNAGACCGFGSDNTADDVAFTRALIDMLLGSYRGDPKRIYVAGFSRGAMLAYRLGIELADEIAAIAPVSGTIITEQRQPAQPVSVLAIHGDADPVVPYQSALKSVQFWAEADGCTASATQQENDRLIQQMYAGCKSNSAVWFYGVKKLGHAWPDQFELNAQNISTAGLIWSFLSSHTKR